MFTACNQITPCTSRRLPSDQRMMACLLGQAECGGTCHPQCLPYWHLVCHLMGSSYALRLLSVVLWLHTGLGGAHTSYLTGMLFSKIPVLTSMKEAENGQSSEWLRKPCCLCVPVLEVHFQSFWRLELWVHRV